MGPLSVSGLHLSSDLCRRSWPIFGPLRAVLGRSWNLCWRSWAALVTYVGGLGLPLCGSPWQSCSGRSWALCWGPWRFMGVSPGRLLSLRLMVLRDSWVRDSWGLCGWSWMAPGTSVGTPRRLLGLLWALLGGSWGLCGCSWALGWLCSLRFAQSA